MTAYMQEPTPEIEAAARALFRCWKARSARSVIPPQPGSYVLDEWENLPPSVTGDFYREAEAALEAAASVRGSVEDAPSGEDEAERAWMKFSDGFNHESAEWLDMGADASFKAGYAAGRATGSGRG